MQYEHYLWSNLEGQSAMPGRFGIYTTCPEVAKESEVEKILPN